MFDLNVQLGAGNQSIQLYSRCFYSVAPARWCKKRIIDQQINVINESPSARLVQSINQSINGWFMSHLSSRSGAHCRQSWVIRAAGRTDFMERKCFKNIPRYLPIDRLHKSEVAWQVIWPINCLKLPIFQSYIKCKALRYCGMTLLPAIKNLNLMHFS